MSAVWRAVAAALDTTIAPSFGAPGFHVRRHTWEPSDVPDDLGGRTYVVTGANAGVGRAITAALAGRGARVVMACRNRARAERAREQLSGLDGVSPERLPIVEIDMASLSSVRRAASVIRERWPTVHALVHNAGILVHERVRTVDGIESTLAVHVVGPYLLTELLAPALTLARPGRLIFVSSGGMYGQRLDVAALEDDPDAEAFDGVVAYARAKRAQVELAKGYAERLAPDVIAVSMHPGWADTGGVREALPGFHRLTKSFLRTADQAADTVVWLAACPPAQIEAGRFYFDRLPRTEHLPGMRTRSNADEVRALWSMCERLAG